MQSVKVVEDNGEVRTFIDKFEITAYGVIVEFGDASEILFPWHRVVEVQTARGGFDVPGR